MQLRKRLHHPVDFCQACAEGRAGCQMTWPRAAMQRIGAQAVRATGTSFRSCQAAQPDRSRRWERHSPSRSKRDQPPPAAARPEMHPHPTATASHSAPDFTVTATVRRRLQRSGHGITEDDPSSESPALRARRRRQRRSVRCATHQAAVAARLSPLSPSLLLLDFLRGRFRQSSPLSPRPSKLFFSFSLKSASASFLMHARRRRQAL